MPDTALTVPTCAGDRLAIMRLTRPGNSCTYRVGTTATKKPDTKSNGPLDPCDSTPYVNSARNITDNALSPISPIPRVSPVYFRQGIARLLPRHSVTSVIPHTMA